MCWSRIAGWAGLVGVTATLACGPAVRRYPLRAPLWQDRDQGHLVAHPAPRQSGLVADALDWTALAPVAELTAVRLPGEAANVNALDEVPDSSWFRNRIGLFPMTPEEVARGPCVGPALDPARGPWSVISAKRSGVTPGFLVTAPDGVRYVVKVDGTRYPERGTAADAIVTRIYHAAGYYAPCNEVVLFQRGVLRRAPGATTTDGRGVKRPLTERDIDAVLAKAVRLEDGRLRAVASRFLPGRPLGPFRWVGVRGDDPNDVVPHEDRRELRALRLLAAWVDHFDIREENSLDMLVTEGGRRFVRHYQLDFGDSFGAPWADDRFARRVGFSYFLDFEHFFVDLVSLGLVPRPWRRVEIARTAPAFGFFGWKELVPSRWRPIYPNPAFGRMTTRDALWMTRIIARFSDAHLAALVRVGKFSRPATAAYLLRALIARRDRILRAYLTRHVALARVHLEGRPATGQALCFEDLAIAAAGITPAEVHYRARMVSGPRLERELWWLDFQPDPAHPTWRCIPLVPGSGRPADLVPAAAPDDEAARYAVVHVGRAGQPGLAVHLYDLGPRRGFVLVGIARGAEATRR